MFLIAYSTGATRPHMLDKVAYEGISILFGVVVGALWGCLVHALLWPTWSREVAEQSWRAAAQAACAGAAVGAPQPAVAAAKARELAATAQAKLQKASAMH